MVSNSFFIHRKLHAILLEGIFFLTTTFLNPIVTSTNEIVMYSVGYKFMNNLKVEFSLLELFILKALLIAPVIWPF